MTVAKKANGKFYGTGRRKSSIARVYLVPGNGNITINKRSLDEYFGLETLKVVVKQPLALTETTEKFDVLVNVHGGGYTGQSIIKEGWLLNKRSSYEGKKEVWFKGSSSCTTVLKEIGFYCILEYNSIRFITPQNFGSGVFFYVNCDKINIMIIGYQV